MYKNPSHSSAITACLLFQRICQETGVPFRVLAVLKMEGKKEHHTVMHCERGSLILNNANSLREALFGSMSFKLPTPTPDGVNNEGGLGSSALREEAFIKIQSDSCGMVNSTVLKLSREKYY